MKQKKGYGRENVLPGLCTKCIHVHNCIYSLKEREVQIVSRIARAKPRETCFTSNNVPSGPIPRELLVWKKL
jgi:hypothetical protein